MRSTNPDRTLQIQTINKQKKLHALSFQETTLKRGGCRHDHSSPVAGHQIINSNRVAAHVPLLSQHGAATTVT